MQWKVLAAVGVVIVLAMPALAQQENSQEPPVRTTVLNVNAQGLSTARPDMATINVGVTNIGPTAQAAQAENAQRMTALVQTLRRAGVAEADIQTSWVRVDPRYERYGDNRLPRIVGYHANNSVRANIRNIDNTGRILDAVVAAGGNEVHGVTFSRQDRDEQLNLARRDAADVARERAEIYARAFGLRVRRVISISEPGAAAPSFDDEEAIVVTGSRIAGGGAPTPVAPGEIETRAIVSVSFELRA